MSGERNYPAENPFPYLGAFTFTPGRTGAGADVTITLPRACIGNLEKLLQDFIDEFRPEWKAGGGVAVLRGPHGSGKTHTVYAALNGISYGAQAGESGAIRIYTLQQDDSFFLCYEQVAARLKESPGLLKRVARSLLGAMAAKQVGENVRQTAEEQNLEAEVVRTMAAKASSRLAEPLRSDPEKAERLFSSFAVEQSATESLQQRALLGLSQNRFNQNLTRAVEALQGKTWDQAAARWLCLEPVTADELSAMGISGPIGDAEEAVAALRFLAALLTIAGQPLILVIDQFEKLFQTELKIAHSNAGYIRSLIEGFAGTNALLVLSGTGDGWNRLPLDVRERVGKRLVDCPLLRLDEAEDLVRVYLTPAGEPFARGAADLAPFDKAAVRAMLALGGGNPRKLLQLCHEAFRAANGGRITDRSVNELARRDPPIYFDRNSALRETKKILTLQSLPFQEDGRVQIFRFDFVVGDGNGNIAMLIDVKEAFFRNDEAASAYVSANMAETLRRMGVQAPVLLVATGYVSPEVIGHLREVVDRLIVYSLDTYEGELRKILDELKARPAAPRAPDPDVNAKLDRLIQLNQSRAKETVAIEKRGADLAQEQARNRYQERLEKARADWGAQRRELEGAIAAERKGRRDDALRHLNAQIRRSLFLLIARDAMAGIAGAFLLFLGMDVIKYTDLTDKQVGWLLVSCAFGLFVVLGLDLLLVLLRPRWWQQISGLREVEVVAAEPLPIILMPYHKGNPFIRLRVRRRSPGGLYSEPLALIRETAIRSAIRSKPNRVEFPAEAWNMPELLLFWEAQIGIEVAGQPPLDVGRARDVLYALVNSPSGSSFDNDGDADSGMPFPLRLARAISRQKGGLYEAFDKGLDRADLQKLPFISERQMREAIQQLSPLAEGGLGTCDFLQSVAQIDQMFLFCSQYLLYAERDLLRIPS